MSANPGLLDHLVFILVFILFPLLDRFWLYPRFLRQSAQNVPGARPRFYLFVCTFAWGVTFCILGMWLSTERPWAALRLGLLSTPLRQAAGWGIAALYIGLMWIQQRRLVAHPDKLAGLRKSLGSAEPMMPRTLAERNGFRFVSVTAGICEEFIYRGFVLWYLAVWTGTYAAIVLSSILFGIAHFYLGFAHVVRTSLVGLVLALIVIASGSLWPAVVIHAAMDFFAGELTFHSFQIPPRNASATPADPLPPG